MDRRCPAVYCPVNQTSCYLSFMHDSFTYAQAKAKCASVNGYVASWDEAEEQLQIENYFRGTGRLTSLYWLGMYFDADTQMWFLENGGGRPASQLLAHHAALPSSCMVTSHCMC